ncbi:MAG: hypothetical protein WDZ28_04790 [Simkaniaceae bacterium]
MKKRLNQYSGFKKGVFALSTLLGFIAVERGTHALTDGFTIHRIRSYRPMPGNFEARPLSDHEKGEVKKILNQPYFYLTSGSQSFVLASQDGQYVLKFIKQHRFRSIFRFCDQSKKQKSLYDLLRSFDLASNLFKEETGVVYTHLDKSRSLGCKVDLVDRLKIKHSIELDQYEYVLQKKMQTASEKLINLKKSDRLPEAKKAFDKLLALTKKRSEMGYFDKDPHLIKNFGFDGEGAVELDIGGFVPYSECEALSFYEKEIPRIKRKVLPWIQKNYPELLLHAQMRLDSQNS